MHAPPRPTDETQRLAALYALHLLDSAREERFDRITRMAQYVFQVPIALINLVDADRLWIKSQQGLALCSVARDSSFCTHAIAQDEIFVVSDARLDARFSDNPSVTGAPFIRFYGGSPLHAESGAKVATLCLLDTQPRDFSASDRRRLADLAAWAERELNSVPQRADQRGLLIARLGHELRTPLTALLGSLGLMQEDMPEEIPASLVPYLDMAMQNSQRLADLVNQLLDAERLASGSMVFARETIDLRAFLQTVCATHQSEAARHHCHLILGSCADIALQADKQRLNQALSHLIQNACKFSPRGSRVEIRGARIGDEVAISVIDEGAGLSDVVKKSLFQPFNQAEAVQFGQQSGIGLGLYLCRALVEGMGGRVELESQTRPGCCFTVRLGL